MLTVVCTRSEVSRLSEALERSTKETEDLRKEISVKDLQIQSLKGVLEKSEAQLGRADNNNPGREASSEASSEDRLYLVLAQLEALSTQVPDDIRWKLEHIASTGKQS